jgi:hypothetical protein
VFAFNKVLAIIVAVGILFGAVITLLVTAGATGPGILPFGWFEGLLQKAASSGGGATAAIISAGVVIALGMIALLFFELMPFRKRVPLLISSNEGGITTIDAHSVCVLAEKTAASIHNVHDIKCRVGAKMGGLVIYCRASVALGSNIPEVGVELQSKVKETVEQLTGLPVAKVDVRTQYEPVEAKRLAVR